MPALLTLTTADGQLLNSISIPTSWADLTLGQYLALAALDSPAPDVVLTGLSLEVLATLSETDRSQLLRLLLFLTEPDVLRELVPTPGLYEIGNCAYGLYRQAEAHFTAHPNLLRLGQGAYLYALFHAPVGNTATAEQIAVAHAAVLAAPVTEVYADCNHFLASWERYQNGSTLPGPTQPGLSQLIRGNHMPSAPSASQGWLSKLGNLWQPGTRAVA